MLSLEFLRLRRDPVCWLASLLLLLATLYGLYQGCHLVEQQHSAIASLQELWSDVDRQTFADRLGKEGEVGYLLYLNTLPTSHPPSAWAALAIGVRDVQPFALILRSLGVYSQLFDSGFENPLPAALGSFDFAFVLTFLLPLAILASGYNLLSADEESCTGRLLASLGTSLARLVFLRWLCRWLWMLGLVSLLHGLAFLWLGADSGGRILFWWGASALYLTFWYALLLLLVTARKGSAFNAIAALSAWVGLALVLPMVACLYLHVRYPIGHGYELILEQRQFANRGWDQPRSQTYQELASLDAQFSPPENVSERFSWHWYFALHRYSDLKVESQAQGYFQALRQRQAWIQRYSLLSPPLLMQELYSQLAQSDLATHLDYLEHARQSHQGFWRDFEAELRQQKSLPASEYSATSERTRYPGWSYPAVSYPWATLRALFALTLGLLLVGAWRLKHLSFSASEQKGRNL